jgi:hypothetical protein
MKFKIRVPYLLLSLVALFFGMRCLAGKPSPRIIAFTAYACQTSETNNGTEFKLAVFPINPEMTEQVARENALSAQRLFSAINIADSIIINLKSVNSDDPEKVKVEAVNLKICEKLGYDKSDSKYQEISDFKIQKIEMSTTTQNGEIYLQSVAIGSEAPISY